MPLYNSSSENNYFIRNDYYIKSVFNKIIGYSKIKPEVMHIRYIDNASLAMAECTEKLGAKLVLTLTPDPHRSMTEKEGKLIIESKDLALMKLNKLYIGDELLKKADGVLGIGREIIKDELLSYFPKLKEKTENIPFSFISEGIDIKKSEENVEIFEEITNEKLKYKISNNNINKGILINVGRLNKLKGQENLVKAFGEYNLWEKYNLLLIGGNIQNPNLEEKDVLGKIDNYIGTNQKIIGSFCHIPGSDNKKVRSLEFEISKKIKGVYPNIYICPSLKEEFGISIIEGMMAGFIVLAPRNGGVKNYLKSGENGFLIDTSNYNTIGKSIESVLKLYESDEKIFENIINNSKKTIIDNFSIEKIASEFLEFYKVVLG